MLRNVRLREDLLARLDELSASRQRVVLAQDQERQRIQRDIQAGPEHQLALLRAGFELAAGTAGDDPGAERSLVSALRTDIGVAVESVRELARGIYPPLLADQGLVAAVRAQAIRATVTGGQVVVAADGVGRYARDVEAAIYFCCLEALRNAGQHARAATARVSLAGDAGSLCFEVADDGPGFDPAAVRGSGLQNMTDRLAALGGTMSIRSRPGAGTTVAGRVPLSASPAA